MPVISPSDDEDEVREMFIHIDIRNLVRSRCESNHRDKATLSLSPRKAAHTERQREEQARDEICSELANNNNADEIIGHLHRVTARGNQLVY